MERKENRERERGVRRGKERKGKIINIKIYPYVYIHTHMHI